MSFKAYFRPFFTSGLLLADSIKDEESSLNWSRYSRRLLLAASTKDGEGILRAVAT